MVAKLPSRTADAAPDTLADLHARLGFVPLHRICLNPAPGTATEVDLLRFLDGEPKRLYELIDGTLVEKAVGTVESIVASALIIELGIHLKPVKSGVVTCTDGPFRMLGRNVRYPDVAFIPWIAIPEPLPTDAIWDVVPALAVEVLSRSNTRREIERKIGELFDLGTRLIWVIDPSTEDATAHRPDVKPRYVGPGDALDGEEVLPGFRLPLADLFAGVRRPTTT